MRSKQSALNAMKHFKSFKDIPKKKKKEISMITNDRKLIYSEKDNILNKIKNFVNDRSFKRTIAVSSKSFEALKKYFEKPSTISGLTAVAQIGQAFFEEFDVWAYDYFSNHKWQSIFNSNFYETVYRCLGDFEFHSIVTSDDDKVIQMFNFFGEEIGVTLSSQTKTVETIHVRKDRVDFIKEKIREVLWTKFKGNNIVMSSVKIPNYEIHMVVFGVDNQITPIHSPEAVVHAMYLQKCINAGVSRSMLFIGSPGTGKSTLVKTIVSKLNLRSLRIRIDELENFDTDTMNDVVETFHPDVIIIDDFDRMVMQSRMLQVMEQLKKTVKLVLLTVNNKNHLEDAILRPGRIDEFVYVENLSEQAVKTILGKEHEHVFEHVKLWPVAFINEYINRCKFMSSSEAIIAMRELATRVSEIRSVYMAEEEERFEKLINSENNKKNGNSAADYDT